MYIVNKEFALILWKYVEYANLSIFFRGSSRRRDLEIVNANFGKFEL